MHRHHTIRRRVTKLLLAMVLTTLILAGAVSLWSLSSMREISRQNSVVLGQTAAEDAQEALEEMAGEQLLTIATEKAAYIEEKFNTVIACLNGIVQAAEAIYRNPQNYPDRAVPLPEKGSRELAPQLLWSRRLADTAGEPVQEALPELYKLGNLQDMLVQYNANNDMISSTYLATVSGWMLQADYIAYSKYTEDSRLPEFFEADARQWYQNARAAEPGQYTYTDVMKDFHEGRDCIVCSKAVFIDGEIVAVAGVGSYLDTVKKAVMNTTIGESGYAFLLNNRGEVLVSGAQSGETSAGADRNADLRESLNTSLARVAEDMVCGCSGLEKLTLDGREVYLAYAPLEKLGWSFATVMDVAEVVSTALKNHQMILALTGEISRQQNNAIKKTTHVFLFMLMVAAVVIGVVSILFSAKLAAPMHRLTEEVRQIDGGNLNSPIWIHTGDEVEELGNAFNAMTAQLRQYIGNLEAATAEKERVRTELTLASRIQADMLPDSGCARRDREEFSLYASMTPAKGVGGDFYDFFLTDEDHLVVLIADVSGKGVPASLFMVVAKTLLQSRIEGSSTLAEAVSAVNERLCTVNKNGMFVTAWIGVLELSTGLLTYVNAGHNPPLFGNGKKGYEYLKERSGFVLAGMEGMAYQQKTLQLVSGDALFLYTDGVTEANDEQGSLYGESRLLALLNSHAQEKPQQLAETVWKDVQDFQGEAEQFDDITMLALYYRVSGKGGADHG
ncbi:MAG: SpoIIE family protein phosphatase [Lachnospiraceae bacterium]|nr:SpoIIE family protein phosphatase [Lachnospiraceae bacterium]